MKKSPLNRGTSQLKRTPLARGTKKLSDRAKKHTQPWYRKECVKVAKLIAKHRDEYTCVNPGCGRNSADGYQMHGSHILPESKFHRMSCVPDNIMTQCARCHMNWHEHPLGQEWFDETFTGLKEKLKDMSMWYGASYIKEDYEIILKQLREEYRKMIN